MTRTRPASQAAAPAEPGRRVQHTLEQQLRHVSSPRLAAAVVQQVHDAAHGTSEAEQVQRASQVPGGGLQRIERATQGRSASARLAAVLVEVATQALGSTPDASTVAEAAHAVFGAGRQPTPATAHRGQMLLRRAARAHAARSSRAEALEAQVFLGLTALPHPGWLRMLAEAVSAVATGGWGWLVGTLLAYLLHVEESDRALKLVTPIVAGVGFVAEGPAKRLCAPRRPFAHQVRMMLLGRKLRGRSFPSGHAATSFAAACVLGSVWPQRRPHFFTLATLVSLTRVYLGAHEPADIVAGAALGIALAAPLCRPAERVLGPIELPSWQPR